VKVGLAALASVKAPAAAVLPSGRVTTLQE
jgi:hypothetical protein